MRNGNPYIGGGRYIQSSGAAGLLGIELARLGARRALVIGGRTALAVASGRFGPGLEEGGIEYRIEEFSGHCTMDRVARYQTTALDFRADIVVGVGGGKALDTAKTTADSLGLGVVTIPTSAATCAAYAILSVIYSEEGDVLYSVFHERGSRCVLVDTDIIVGSCPARMLASGIADAAAKYPEIAFSMEFSTDWEKSVLPSAALALSRFTWDTLFRSGHAAVRSVGTSPPAASVELEDCVCAAIALTGTVSSLVSGGRQLAVAHSFYDGVCKHFKPQQRRFLHGEIVSAGILLQMYVNGRSPGEIDSARVFLRELGTPASLEDLGLDHSKATEDTLMNYIAGTMALGEEWMTERLERGLREAI